MVQPQEAEPSSLIALANPSSSSDLAATPDHEVVRQQINVARAVLNQAVDLIDNHLTSDEQLSVNSKYISGSTIGKHIRHAVDHVNILLNSMSSPSPRVISYDIRIRNTSMETNRQSASKALLETIANVEKIIPSMNFDEEIVLNAITPYTHTFKTTLGREVWFVSLHCLHHWTVVRLIAGELGVLLSEDFGFAPSTLLNK